MTGQQIRSQPEIDLPEGATLNEISEGLWEVTLPNGKKAELRRSIDGSMSLRADIPKEAAKQWLTESSADIRTVREGNRTRYLAWISPLGGESQEADIAARVVELYAPLREHIASGRLSGQVARDVVAFLDGMALVIDEVREAGRAESLHIAIVGEHEQSAVRRKGGMAKIAKNPVAKAKANAKQAALLLWIERNEGRHRKLRTVDQYATEVMRRWPILTSHKVICGWSGKWSKAMKAGEAPAC